MELEIEVSSTLPNAGEQAKPGEGYGEVLRSGVGVEVELVETVFLWEWIFQGMTNLLSEIFYRWAQMIDGSRLLIVLISSQLYLEDSGHVKLHPRC